MTMSGSFDAARDDSPRILIFELPPGVPPYRGEDEDNEILREIRATRRQMLEECGGDLGKLLDRARQHQAEHPDPNHPVVSFIGEEAEAGSCVVREEPPKPKNS